MSSITKRRCRREGCVRLSSHGPPNGRTPSPCDVLQHLHRCTPSSYCRSVADLTPGLYEQLVTAGLERHLRLIPGELTQREGLDPADAHEVLARHVAVLVNRALRNAGRGTATETASLQRQVELANSIGRAVAAAATAEVAVVVVGTNDDWETEGEDRVSMDLPGAQDELVALARLLTVSGTTFAVVAMGAVLAPDALRHTPRRHLGVCARSHVPHRSEPVHIQGCAQAHRRGRR
jgi:hypothetical protein